MLVRFSVSSATRHTRHPTPHVPTRALKCLHAPTRAYTCFHAPTDIIATSSSHVNPSCVIADIIRSRHRWLHLQIDFDLRQLTLSALTLTFGELTIDFFQGWLLQSIFAYFASKWRIRTSLLPFATIIANNPTNVFAIFANVLAII